MLYMFASYQKQRGAVLVIGLIILLLMTIIGVTAMRNTTLQEKMAGNMRDSNLAFQASEAALREGEAFLNTSGVKLFTNNDGLYQPTPSTTSPWKPRWQLVDWSQDSNVLIYSGVLGNYISANPRFIIEDLGVYIPPNVYATLKAHLPPPESRYFRITSRAVGGSDQAVVMLQSVYRN